jgi:uncharacterized SAM-binding protein YcdF (DUF218 family)
MPPSLQDAVLSLTHPPALSFWLLVCGALCLFLRWRATAVAFAAFALAWSLSWSIPQASDWLRSGLESRHPVVDAYEFPVADAIVVQGGGHYGWLRDGDIQPELLRSSRLAAGARAWQAGRAPLIILSGSGGETATMAAAVARFDIPDDAVLLENRSRSTRDNARFTAALAQRHGVERILLVTSSLHMPRALQAFHHAGLEAIPVPVPEIAPRAHWRDRWLPSRRALWRSGRALKEYAGLLWMHLFM